MRSNVSTTIKSNSSPAGSQIEDSYKPIVINKDITIEKDISNEKQLSDIDERTNRYSLNIGTTIISERPQSCARARASSYYLNISEYINQSLKILNNLDLYRLINIPKLNELYIQIPAFPGLPSYSHPEERYDTSYSSVNTMEVLESLSFLYIK